MNKSVSHNTMANTDEEWSRIVSELRVDDDVERAVKAIEDLIRVSDESRVFDLRNLIQDDDVFIREAAAQALAKVQGIQALPVLFEALSKGFRQGHDNDLLSHTIIEIVEANKDEVRPLLSEMAHSNSSEARENAAWALGFVGSHSVMQILLQLLTDENPAVRAAAAGSLVSYKSERIVDALLPLLNDESEEVRASVASSLGYLGMAKAIPKLRQCLDDSAERVRFFANWALEHIERTAT